jgi:hypothetical protein
MERRDVAGHQGSDEFAYKCHSEDAHVLLRQLVSKGFGTDALQRHATPGRIRAYRVEPGRSGRDLQATISRGPGLI